MKSFEEFRMAVIDSANDEGVDLSVYGTEELNDVLADWYLKEVEVEECLSMLEHGIIIKRNESQL